MNGQRTAVDVAVVLSARGRAFRVRLKNGDHVEIPKTVVSNWDKYEEGDVNVTMDIETRWLTQHNIRVESL